MKKVVVGRIEKIEKHPDADKLVVCQIDVGEQELQIVTGADNVFEGGVGAGGIGGSGAAQRRKDQKRVSCAVWRAMVCCAAAKSCA